MTINKKGLDKRGLKRWGKTHLVLMKDKFNCQSCKKAVKESHLVPTREKKLVCDNCYLPQGNGSY